MASGMKFVYLGVGGQKKVFILGPEHPRAVIGRNPDCEILTDFVQVSRIHAILEWENGHVFLSFPPTGAATNGLEVYGRHLRANERVEVFSGTRLTVGTFWVQAYDVNQILDDNFEPMSMQPMWQHTLLGYGPPPYSNSQNRGVSAAAQAAPLPMSNGPAPCIYGPLAGFQNLQLNPPVPSNTPYDRPSSYNGPAIGIYGPPPGVQGLGVQGTPCQNDSQSQKDKDEK